MKLITSLAGALALVLMASGAQAAPRSVSYAVAACDAQHPTLCLKPGYSYANITTATTTTVKSGAGALSAITVNTLAGAATITLYDNTAGSGTKIGTVTLPATITSATPFTLPYQVLFSTGLTIVTSGSTDITVSYQ